MNPSIRTRRYLGFALAATLVTFACTDDNNTTPASVDKIPVAQVPTGSNEYDLVDQNDVLVNGARWISGLDFKVGTGVIDPFLSIQQAGQEEGFNTDGDFEYNQTRSNFTDALPLNLIPTIEFEGERWREIILDANEANSGVAAQFSIDFFELWLCSDPAAPTFTLYSDFDSGNPECVLIYDLGLKGGLDAVLLATDGKTNGSGNSLDYQILIPEIDFDNSGKDTPECSYNPEVLTCGTYVILKTHMGGKGGDWVTGSTFEEYSTIQRPYVNISKTANTSLVRSWEWTIEKTVDPDSHTLFEGQSGTSTYTVTVTKSEPIDGDWSVSGVITIENPTNDEVSIDDVTDEISGVGSTAVSCGVSFPYILAGNATLECTYTQPLPDGADRVNTAEVELTGGNISQATADILFNEATDVTEVLPEVNVDDTNGMSWLFDDSGFETYDVEFTCDEDGGQHDNTATIVETGDSDDATVNVYCLDLNVTKDANTSLERTYKWTIDKSVTPASWDLFTGDDGTSQYTVTVSPDGFDDAQWAVDGTINIAAPGGNNSAVYIQSIADVVSPAISATVENCADGVTPIDLTTDLPYALAPGNTITCDYSTSLPDNATRTNTATVSAKPTPAGTAKDFSGDASVDFTGVSLTEINKTVNVTDTYAGALGSVDWDSPGSPFTYDRTFYCDNDEGQHDNVATITETGQSDDASVSVACYQLVVTKDAATTWKRDWTWSIDKALDPSHFLEGTYDEETGTATIMQGQSLDVYWDLTIQAFNTDSDFNVTGNIAVSNAGNPIPATINDVTDLITAGNIDGLPVCGVTFPYSLAAGATLNCTYDPGVDLGNPDDRTNTATATQQNFSYDYLGVGSPNGTTDYSGVADILFAATPTMETDACVDVQDVLTQAGLTIETEELPDNWCVTDGNPHTFQDIVQTFGGTDGIFVDCGDNLFTNTATIITDDNAESNSDDEDINIFVECVEGCTLTIGYWKTHSDYGPAAHPDDNWDSVGGPDAIFFLSGQSWYEVFWTQHQGNAYYMLAWQYMGAVLNLNNGAGSTADVDAAIAWATDFFQNHTPDEGFRGRDGNELRSQLVYYAGILASYNEGDIGPGHCTENGNGVT